MNKKKFYIIRTCCLIAIIIIFEIIMYYAVGEDVLSQKGTMRNLFILFPVMIAVPSLVIDFIGKKVIGNNDRDKDK